MKKNQWILNLNPDISLPAGFINQNEISTLPSWPWPVPDAIGHYPALFDGHPCARVHVLFELLFMGWFSDRTCARHDRCIAYDEASQVNDFYKINSDG
jgi:hypothetical protein